MAKLEPREGSINLRFRVRDFGIPPVHDALVLGRRSPIGCSAFRKMLELLNADVFEHVEFEDDVLSDILVRSSILRKVPPDKLIDVVVRRLKPLMNDEEVLHLDIEAELLLEEQL
ncbi:MAG: hypothetical protein ACE5EC_06915 [Phycisphaerae bacterium]